MRTALVERENHIANSTAPGTLRSLRQMIPCDRKKAASMTGWAALIAVCYALGELGNRFGAPAPHLLVSLFIGAIAAMTGLVRRGFPAPANRAAQAGVGTLMGCYVTPAGLQAAGVTALPLLGITAATIVLCVAAGFLLSRVGRISTADGTLGMVPGGSAAIVAAAEELRADGRLVAFSQYLRVALVALTAPVVAFAVHPRAHEAHETESSWFSVDKLQHFVDGPHQVAGILLFVAVSVLGVQAGRRLSLPAYKIIGPMLLATLAVFTGAAQGFTPVGILRDVLFAGVGLEVGLRFTRQSVRHMGRLLPHVLIGTILVCMACGGLAWALSTTINIPLMDAYLATTPGGINAVLATAVSTDSDVPVVSTVQSARLFIVMLITPPIIRWLTQSGKSANDERGSRASVAQEPALVP